MRRARHGILPLLVLLWGACSASRPALRPTTAPPLPKASPVPALNGVQTLPNGLRVLHLPSSSHDLELGLFFPGGPIDDPAEWSGLTSFLPDVGLLPLSGGIDPSAASLRNGSRVQGVRASALFGWSMTSAEGEIESSLRLLHRIVTRESLPPGPYERLRARTAEELGTVFDPAVYQAWAVAAGASMGHGRPVGLYGRDDAFGTLDASVVLAHWRRLVVPERAVLVVAGGADDSLGPAALAALGSWRGAKTSTAPLKTCWIGSETSHLIVDAESTAQRVYILLALRVPGLGEPGREEVEIGLETLSAVPDGRLARVVGEAKARSMSPHIIDLGWNGGDKGSLLLMRVSGRSRETLRALWNIIEAIHGLGRTLPVDAELLASRRRHAEQRQRDLKSPGSRLLAGARRVLYGEASFSQTDFKEHARSIFRRRSVSVVGVGPRPLAPVLAELGTLTIWDKGGLILKGGKHAGCR